MAMAESNSAVMTPNRNPLSRKLHKILESDLDNDKETLEALKVLSDCLDKNTLQARRNLRSDLEKRSLALNEEFLGCVKELVQQVRGLQEETSHMKGCCDDMQKRLLAAKSRTSGLLRETSQLQCKSRLLDMKSKVASSFLHKFQLSPEQLRLLSGAPEKLGISIGSQRQIGDEFFQAMHRVQEIHEDCKVLLHMSKQRAGLEIMESMAIQLESAYERLYHWTQNQCRLMTGEIPDFNVNLRCALKELKKRPVLFQYCIDEYIIARRTALVQSFIDALTRDGLSGRPMELHSHDPVRYCGDMLGWLHQAIATENDHVFGLLAEEDYERAVSILIMITEGCCRPLNVRIEQVIVTTDSAVVAYKLVNLLCYYCGVFLKNLSSTAPLVKTVSDLTELQSKMFFSTLNTQVSKILGEIQAPLIDLSPTFKQSELLNLLQQLLSSRDMTVFTGDNQNQDLRMILSCCIDPLIQHCNVSVSTMTMVDRSIYLINCLYVIQSTVSLYEFTDRQVESLEMQIQSHMDKLSSEQFRHLLGLTGLADFHDALFHRELAEEDYRSLDGCSEKLRALISAPDQFQLNQSRLVTSGRLREDIMKRAIDRFCGAYESVFDDVVAAKMEVGVLTYTPQQTRQLLLN